MTDAQFRGALAEARAASLEDRLSAAGGDRAAAALAARELCWQLDVLQAAVGLELAALWHGRPPRLAQEPDGAGENGGGGRDGGTAGTGGAGRGRDSRAAAVDAMDWKVEVSGAADAAVFPPAPGARAAETADKEALRRRALEDLVTSEQQRYVRVAARTP